MGDLFDIIQPVAESAGMGWYMKQIQKECRTNNLHHLAELSTKGCMKDILNQNKPIDGEILLVRAKTGMERKAFHTWAESQGYRHCGIKTSHFECNVAYYCKECKKIYYHEEMSVSLDWSTIYPGQCYGSYIKCFVCDSYCDMDDPKDSDVIRKGECFNAVIMGKILPTLSKHEKRKHKKKHQSKSTDINLLDNIGNREIKIMTISEFNKLK